MTERWPEFMTVPTAAAYIDGSESLVRKLIKEQGLPTVLLGGRARRIPRQALDAYLEKKMAGPVTAAQVVPGLRVSRSGRSPW